LRSKKNIFQNPKSVALSIAGLLALSGCSASEPESSPEPPNDSDSQQQAQQQELPSSDQNEQPSPPEVEIQPVEINVYSASDLDPSIAEVTEKTLNLAKEEWGLEWALEYWLLGTERETAEELISQFCETREQYNQWEYEECVARETDEENFSMMTYQALGEQGLEESSPASSAARNGFAEWKMHNFVSSPQWGLIGQFGIPGKQDLNTILHEYWHAHQSEAIDYQTDRPRREELMGPVWFVEGSAEFMAQYTMSKLESEGRLPEVPAGEYSFSFEDQMRNKLFPIDNAADQGCEGRNLLSLVEYSDPCSQLAYEKGAWAIAYLTHIGGPDVLLTEFHPNIEQLGFGGAFEKAAGMSLQEFEAEFEEFIGQSTQSRLSILES
jgi:hypothetical protein